MYVRVLTANLSPRVRALSIRFVGTVSARGEAIAEPPANEPRDTQPAVRRPSGVE
jgi:hypothetical protein